MDNSAKSIKNRYFPFVITAVILIITVLLVVRHSVNCQAEDSHLINLSGKQRMLSQSISKVVFSINKSEDEASKFNSITSLKVIVEEFENSHKYLVENNKDNSVAVDSLLGISQIYLNKIVQSSWNIINEPYAVNIKDDVTIISNAEASYMTNMDLLVLEYQKKLDQNLKDLANYINLLAIGAFLIIIGQYIFIIAPSFKQLFNRNTDISAVEEELSISKNNQELSKMALNKVNLELKAILNSGPIAIISTDINGVINHFNHGAELLLGYSASEMIGLNEPEIFHIREELDDFRIDLAETYGAEPEGFDPYLELAKRNLYDTREWTFKRKDGSFFPVQLTLNAIKNSAGEKVGFLGIAFDITERKKAKEELLKKNQLLNFSEVITKTGHWKWDVVADRVKWSENLYNLFELDKDVVDIQFDTYFNYVHHDDKNLVAEKFDDAISGKGFKSFVHKISTNGKTKTIQILGEITTNDKGEVIEMIGTCQDITEQRMAENKFRSLLESAPDAMIIVDEAGLIQIANKQAEILFGYTSSELIGQSAGILFPKRIAYYFEKYQANYFGNPKIKSIGVNKDSFAVTKDGKEIQVQLSLSPLETEEGILVSTALRDITVQKTAEKELIRKNQLLNFAEKITKMGNWQWDLVTNDLYWSTNLCKIFEIDENTNITFETYFDFVHPDDKESVSDQIKESIEGELFESVVHRIILKSGVVKIIQLLAVVVKDEAGDVVEMIGSCQDITEQRMAENKFKGLLESAPDAMIIVNDKGIIQLANKQAEHLFGYPAFDLINESVEILIPKRFAEYYEMYLTDSFGDSKVKSLDMRAKELYTVNRIGEEIPVQISVSPLQTEEGLLVSVAIRDITVQKIAENKLLQQNQLLNLAEEITATGHWKWSIKDNRVEWSDALYNIFERDKTLNDITYETYFEYVHDDDKEVVGKNVMSAVNGGDFESISYRVVVNGKIKIIQLLGQSIKNEKGEVVELIGTCRDVTDKLVAENKFRGLLESAPDAMIMVDKDGLVQIANKQAEILFGYTSSELIGGTAEVLFPERIAPYFHKYQSEYFGNPKVKSIGVYDDSFIVTKEGKEIQVQLSLSPFEGDDGVLVSTAIRDVTIQKTAERELLKRNQLLSFAEIITKMGNWQWDYNANVLNWSPSLCRIFEIEDGSKMTFEKYFQFVHPDDREFVYEKVQESLNGKQFNSVIHRIVVKSGTIKTIQLLAVITNEQEGEVIELVGSCQDITVITAAERDLFDANTQLNALFNSGRIAIISVDNKGIVNHFNHGAELLLGYSASEMIGLQKPDVYHLENEMVAFKKDIAKKYNKEDLSDFSPFTELSNNDDYDTREWTFIRKDGIPFPVELTLTAIKNIEGEKIGFLAVANNISERKRATDELLRKNQILSFAEEITLMGNWQADILNNTTKWSANLYAIFELEESTITTLDTYLNYTHPEDKERVAKHMQDTIEGKYFSDLLHRIQLDSGEVKTVHLLAQVITDNLGVVTEVIGTCQDVTKQKQAENDLIRKNYMLSFAEEITLMGNWQVDVINKKTKWSKNLYRIFELKESTSMTQNTYLNLVFAEDRDRVTKHIIDTLKNKSLTSLVHRIELPDGSMKTLQILGQVFTNEKGEVSEIIGTCQDITLQKIGEEELLRKNQLLTFAEEITLMGNWQWDTVLDKVKWSKNLYNIYQLDLNTEDLSFDTYFNFVHPDDKESVTIYFEKTRETKRLERFTHRVIAGDGTFKIIQLLGEVITNDKGEVVEMIGTCQDITLQKMGEEELLRKNQLLTFAEEITMMGNWQWNVIDDTAKWSNNLYNIFELDGENADLCIDLYFKYVHPDDKDLVMKHFDHAIRGNGFRSFQHRIITNGKTKTVQLLGEVIKNEKGEVVEVIGTCQDVTEQKMAENKFRGLLESAPDAMVIVNEKGNIQLINKQAEMLFGYSLNELFSRPVELLILERFAEDNSQYKGDFFSDPEIIAMGVASSKEFVGLNKEGKKIPIQVSLSPLQTEEGLLVSAAIRDISAQKEAERKILQAKDDLEVLTQHLSGQNKQLEDFAHISSHNLRSPVSNLNALLYLYNETENKEERKEVFDKFEVVIGHLTSTLNTLIEALKTKKESVKELEMLSFDDVLKKTKEIISQKIIDNDSIVTSDFSKVPIVEYHKTYLESIFLNLLTNAIKYKSPDRKSKVHIETKIVNKKTVLTIKDNGLGIDLEKHGHKLFGLNKTFHRHPEAKGVGLYLTKIQIETMGGAIYATSEIDKGTTFTVILNNPKNEKFL